MDITKIIQDNLPEGVEVSEKTLKSIAKEISAEQGKLFVSKEQYNKKISELDEVKSEISSLKDQVVELEPYKEKCAKVEDDFKNYKQEVSGKEEINKKTDLVKKSLESEGANSKLLNLLMKEIDISKVEVETKDGIETIKDWNSHLTPLKTNYSEVFGEVITEGAKVSNPPPTDKGGEDDHFLAGFDGKD